MIADKIFQVVTEFRFDIGHAVADTKTLQGQVDQLSAAADNALFSFQRLGMGLVASMGLGAGGLAGILGSAIKASEKFAQSQRDFTNIIMANLGHIGTFNEVMAHTETIMDNINKKANEFALPADELLAMTKGIGAILLNKGLDDASLSKSIDLSRQFLKSAPTLGVDPTLARGQLTRAILGDASMSDTLFLRLAAETSAMRQFAKTGGSQAFNALEPAKRLKILTEALAQFSSNIDVIRGNARSLTSEMRRLQEALIGTFSILRPVGQVLTDFILPTFHKFNNYLRVEGREIAQGLANLLRELLSDPESLITNLMQLRKAGEDLRQTGGILTFAGILQGLGWVLSKVTGVAKLAHPAIGLVAAGVGTLATGFNEAMPLFNKFMLGIGSLLAFLALAIKFPAVIGFIGAAFMKIFTPLLLIYGVLQLFSRAAAISKIEDAKAMAALMPRFTEAMAKLQRAFKPLTDAFMAIFDGLARKISPLFRVSFYFELLTDLIEWIADTTAKAIAGFQGLAFAIMQFVTNVYNKVAEFIPGMKPIGKSMDISTAFNAGVDDILAKYFRMQEEGKAISGQTVNIGKVEITNQFKENMQPDRIAFSLKEQLLKVAQNPTQARGRSFSTSQAGAF